MDRHQNTLSTDSSTSAVDLSGTLAGLATSRPSSPTLSASDSRNSFPRRRTSWGRVDAVQDPLRFNLASVDAGSFGPGRPQTAGRNWDLNDDPFVSPTDDEPHFAHHIPSARYQDAVGVYPTAQPGPSSVSLISNFNESGDTFNGARDDDEAHLTSNMSRPGTSSGWGLDADSDPEQSAASARTRRKTVRYSTSPSPLKKTGSTLMAVSRNLQRASLRVVNFAGFGLEEHVRLADSDEDRMVAEKDQEVEVEVEDVQEEDEVLPDLTKTLPIRGRTLGFMSSTNRLRLAMYQFLVYPWTEPCILLLIIFNAVVLTLQAVHSTTLPANGTGSPPHIVGFFHTWEDYALFIIFCLFTLEAFARISVSGFLLDPEIPVSSFLSSFSTYPESAIPSTSVDTNTSLSRHPSLVHSHSQAQLPTRRPTFLGRIEQLFINISRPFALRHNTMSLPREVSSTSIAKEASQHPRKRSDTAQSKTPMIEKVLTHGQQVHSHIRNPSHPTFFSTMLRSDNPDMLSLPFRLSITNSQEKTHRNVPYLRHSWSRIDFVAIMGFWVCFALSSAGVERGTYHIGIFRALSVLRIARLLAITSGTTTIMRSLKTARPLIASVAYFVLFAMILFSIIGIQSFNGSFRRSCHLLPTLGVNDTDLGQSCGAYIDADTLQVMPYITQSGLNGTVKGFVCPVGQVCMENPQNPQDDIESFDAIYLAALQVVIVASANGWSPIMYSMMDSEFFVSSIFFIICVIVLNFWLINLFVAVITNTFSAIRSDTKKSAFGAASVVPVMQESDEGWAIVDGKRVLKHNRIKDIYESIRWCWVALALTSVVLQATRTVDVGPTHASILDIGELTLTVVFDVEIIIRVLAHLPDWRGFFYRGQNILDLILAIGSSVIQIPVIHHSDVYPWLTIFQLARFYRVILEIPRMKPLLLAVFGNMYGLANMTLFLLLINFVAALVGVQLLRGDVPQGNFIDWGQVYNAFLAVYQVFSSENWTDVLYNSAQAEVALRQAPVVILFISIWMFFANFIVLQMFIAVINENFEVAEESKRSQQASHYWASHRPQQARAPWVRKLNPYRWFKAQPKAIAVDHLPSNLVLPMQKTLVEDYTLRIQPTATDDRMRGAPRKSSARSYLRKLQQLFTGDTTVADVPMATIKNGRRQSVGPSDEVDEETERHLEVLAALNPEALTVEDLNDALYERRAQKADFIRDHPTYDKTFWIFSQKNPLRRLCQKLVAPAGGERIFGAAHSPIAHTLFQLLLLLVVVAGIVVEGIATPIYRRSYYQHNGLVRASWFDMAEAAFGLMLLLEFCIKVVADGFLFTPNAYVRSIWNILDFLILAGVLVNVSTGVVFVGGMSRLTRSLKALRALRLITLIEKMRSTFESLIISGAARILDAALLAILYMIPYAVWGLNIFAGLTNECNDTNASGIGDCVGEFSNTIYGNDFGFLVPRVWNHPSPSTTFSFDNFRESLLILFEIVSLEGWIDVMGVATSITGEGLQPQVNASQVNSIFFLIYNLLGAVVILTLFVSIIIGNFTSRTGSALLTQPQREWIDLQKLITRQRPSKRPKRRPTWRLRAWCYDRAVHKHGWWHRMMTAMFVLHVFVLMTQTFKTETAMDGIRKYFFLFVTIIYTLDAHIRLYGLGWRSYSANGWNIFDLIVAGGSLFTTVIVRFESSSFVVDQLQKLFITSIAFKLVQRTNSLNKLFKTAVASLPVIMSLLGLWLILFFFFAILFLEVFSLTKWNTAETRNENYTTLAKALVMLSFMTTGEGWNQYMHDFAIVYPRCTTLPNGDSDCGSAGWAFTLFIAWNVLSMYIFVNLFTGVVVESFYYVFQISGGSKSIAREEMRAFKKVWAEFANPKTGYLERTHFVPFFSKLSGVFEVKIYPTEYSIPNIVNRVKEAPDAAQLWSPRVVEGVDLDKLSVVLGGIDRISIKKRKNLYNRLYHEARISHEPGRGISFTNMLLLLAHHKLIVDRDALVLKDLVVRTEKNKLVTDLVDFDRVQSLLLMISYRRRFLRHREEARLRQLGEQDIPAIVVDSFPTTPPMITRDITSPGQDTTIRQFADSDSPTRALGGQSSDLSFAFDSPLSRPALQRSRRTSDISMLSIETSPKLDVSSRDSRYGDDDPDSIMSSMQNSMWNGKDVLFYHYPISRFVQQK
ncbi:Ion transport protein-domain-containing protein [Amylocystis lapponica]|nr:Ion transport protein-domain-containing protein [Amylocystis lapponica]